MHASGPFGWNDLPADFDFSLTARGAVTRLFTCRSAQRFSEALRIVAHLPYGRNATRDDPAATLREDRGTCSTKHSLLKMLADEHGTMDVRLMLGIYRMREENTPGVGPVLSAAGLDYMPEAHTYLRVGGAVVDCTTAGSGRAAFLPDMMEEREIFPAQTGAWKVAYHRSFLQEWMAGNFSGTLDKLWTIREACIAALSQR